MQFIIVAIVLGLICGFVSDYIAKEKGYKSQMYFWLGFFFSFVGIIVAAVQQDKNIIHKEELKVINAVQTSRGVDINSPVDILSYKIFKRNNGAIGLSINFRNLNKGILKAIKIKAKGYNYFGDVIFVNGKETFEIILQDLNIETTSEFSNHDIINLPSDEIRNIDMFVSQAYFEDGTVVNNTPEIVEPTILLLEAEESEILKEFFKSAICYPKQEEYYWLCGCGTVNSNSLSACRFCLLEKKEMFSKFSESNMAEAKYKRKEQKMQKDRDMAEAEGQRRERDKRIKKKIIIRSGIACVLIAAIIIVFSTIVSPKLEYNKANELLQKGKYGEALSQYKKLDGYKDSEYQIKECYYQIGLGYIKNGDFENAKPYFEIVGDYKDSSEQIKKIVLHESF